MNYKRMTMRSAGIAQIGLLLVLSGCNWFGKKESSQAPAQAMSETVLATIDGRPILTVEDFEQYEEQLLQANPQLRAMISVMPDVEKNLYDALISQEPLLEWVHRTGIDQTPEFKKELEQNMHMVERGLAIKRFQQDNAVNVSDSEIKKYYDENKETIYLMSPAGIATMSVSFDREPDAQAFLNKAKAPNANFNTLAQNEKLNVRNLGRINEQSQYVDEAIKKAVLKLKKFPTTIMIKTDDGKFAVVFAQSKEDAKYYPYEQAKEDAKARIYNDKMGQMLNDTLAKLKKEYNVIENGEYFTKKAAEHARPMALNEVDEQTLVAEAPTAVATQNNDDVTRIA